MAAATNHTRCGRSACATTRLRRGEQLLGLQGTGSCIYWQLHLRYAPFARLERGGWVDLADE